MIQAASLDFDAVADRMRAIVSQGVAPTGCWAITVPDKGVSGIAWQFVLAGLWANATFNSEAKLAVAFEELAVVPDGRVLVLIGVHRHG